MLFRFILYSSGQCSTRALTREYLERWHKRQQRRQFPDRNRASRRH
jgi:hypothetical protein